LVPTNPVADRVAAGTFDLAHQSSQLVSSSRPEHDFCASSGQQQRRRPTDAAAGARDRHDLAVNASHCCSPGEPNRTPSADIQP
jgi:hypothetical protein